MCLRFTELTSEIVSEITSAKNEVTWISLNWFLESYIPMTGLP